MSAVVPAGWKLVPVEPTDEMEAAAEDDYENTGATFPRWKSAYTAMLDAAPSHPPATPAITAIHQACKDGDAIRRAKESTPAVAVQAEPSELLRQRANEIASMAKPDYFNKVRAAVLALAAHPKPAAPATADDAASVEAIRRLFVEHGHIYAGWLELARAILDLRSGASAQPAEGGAAA